MNTKSKSTILIIYAVVAIVYAVCFFVIPFEKNPVTWSAFAFGCVAIIAGAIAGLVSFDNQKEVKSKIYGFPIFRLGYYYTIVQLLLSIIFAVAGSFIEIPVWIVVVSGIVLLGVFIIGVVSIDRVREAVEYQDVNDAVKTKSMETFKVDIDSLVRKSPDENVRKTMEKLSEDFKYSDPVSSDDTKEIEEMIKEKLRELSERIVSSPEKSIELINELDGLLNDRNRMCRNSK